MRYLRRFSFEGLQRKHRFLIVAWVQKEVFTTIDGLHIDLSLICRYHCQFVSESWLKTE